MDVDAQRLFDVIDELRADIKDINHRLTTIETQYCNHIDDMIERQKGREKMLYGIMAVMTIGFTTYEVFFS